MFMKSAERRLSGALPPIRRPILQKNKMTCLHPIFLLSIEKKYRQNSES